MLRMRRSFSKMMVQQPREASTSRIMTLLTIGSACRKRPRNDMSCAAAGTISFMRAISLHKGNGVDLGRRLDRRQAILAGRRRAFAGQDVVEENAPETGAVETGKIEELDQGLAGRHGADFDGQPLGGDAVGVEREQVELQ